LIDEVKKHIEDLLNRQWISKSKSAWSSPLVLVRKKDGKLRLCCDFRKLNSKTIPDKHPLPKVQSSLDSLGGNRYFTVLDQTRAYYQGFIEEKDRPKTAFVTPWGLYEWNRIPFGLMNAPACFQRHMEEIIHDFRDKCAIPYLDDVIVYSKTFEEHLQHVSEVLKKLKTSGLKLNFEKCNFFQSSAKFLGRIVSKEGYRMDESSVAAVHSLKGFKPRNIGDIRHLLGLIGYHRRHIADFSRKAKPITNILLSQSKKTDKSSKRKFKIDWTSDCEAALNALIDEISSAPILAYPNFEEEFIVHTDASQIGLGAVLCQRQDGKLKVVAYGSRTLTKAEAKYHATKLEFLALKWAVTEAFREYLGYANHFLVYTDNNPLVFLLESKKLTAYSERWISELSEYNFTLKYRPGPTNKDADCLSRLPMDLESSMKSCSETIDQDTFRAIMANVQTKGDLDESWRCVIGSINADITPFKQIPESWIENNITRISAEQRKDPDMSVIVEAVSKDLKLRPLETDSTELKSLKRVMEKMKLTAEGVLVKDNGTDSQQVVLPKSMRQSVYQNLHVDMGHLGPEKVYAMAKRRVFWPGMERDITEFINQSCLCLIQKKPHSQKKAPLQPIITTVPMELLTIDFVKLERGTGGNQYILVLVDHFSRFAQAYATRNKSSATVAKKLYNDFVLRFGLPARILSDQGREFENQTIGSLNKLMGVQKSRTTPYHPQSNGACERMNQTLLKMLRSLPEKEKSRWPDKLNKMVHAYNCSPHSSTGYSPFFLMFGREPKLPIDMLVSISKPAEASRQQTYNEFVKRWRKQMESAYAVANQNSANSKKMDKDRWDAKVLLSPLGKGDRVLVQNKSKREEGPHKLRSYWEPDVYKILEVMDKNGVVYKCKRDDGKGRIRILHRNMLLPVGEMFVTETSGPHQRKADQTTKEGPMTTAGPSAHDEEEDELAFILQPAPPDPQTEAAPIPSDGESEPAQSPSDDDASQTESTQSLESISSEPAPMVELVDETAESETLQQSASDSNDDLHDDSSPEEEDDSSFSDDSLDGSSVSDIEQSTDSEAEHETAAGRKLYPLRSRTLANDLGDPG
jgi:transposase InsO family protein